MHGTLWPLSKLKNLLINKNFLIVFFLLIIGLVLYALFYPPSIFINSFIQKFFEYLLSTDLPITTSYSAVYNLPTTIWSFCFIFTILSISNKIDWIVFLSVFLIIVPELLQHPKINLIHGTFDNFDLLGNAFGIMFAIIMSKFINHHPPER